MWPESGSGQFSTLQESRLHGKHAYFDITHCMLIAVLLFSRLDTVISNHYVPSMPPMRLRAGPSAALSLIISLQNISPVRNFLISHTNTARRYQVRDESGIQRCGSVIISRTVSSLYFQTQVQLNNIGKKAQHFADHWRWRSTTMLK